MDNFFGFRIIENLQKMDEDIQRESIQISL